MRASPDQCVLISFFRFSGKNMVWAMAQMARMKPRLRMERDIEFFKVLGTGGGRGYSALPDFSQYALLTAWPTREKAEVFLDSSPVMTCYRKRSDEMLTFILLPVSSRGRWSGQDPFRVGRMPSDNLPLVVLTRARLNWRFFIPFWRRVGRVSRSQKYYHGQLFSQGVGEWPWIEQATFSIWRSEADMERFARGTEAYHREAIQAVRRQNGFREELYARFQLVEAWGGIEGKWNEKMNKKGFMHARGTIKKLLLVIS